MPTTTSRHIDVTGQTIEDAIDRGLVQLGLNRTEVIIEIIEEGSRGMLGMGARDALVRLTPLRDPGPRAAQNSSNNATPAQQQAILPTAADNNEEIAIARKVLKELLDCMGLECTIHVYQSASGEPGAEDNTWVLDIHGENLGNLIGRRGETLNALQYLMRLIVSRHIEQRATIVLDVEGYKLRREEALRKLAYRMADQAKKMGRTVTLEPMPPNERRIIHIALREDGHVVTESIGVGERRKVTISPVQ